MPDVHKWISCQYVYYDRQIPRVVLNSFLGNIKIYLLFSHFSTGMGTRHQWPIYFLYNPYDGWCLNGTGSQNIISQNIPDSKVYGANMGPTWGRQDPGGPHVGPWTLLYGIRLVFFFFFWGGGLFWFQHQIAPSYPCLTIVNIMPWMPWIIMSSGHQQLHIENTRPSADLLHVLHLQCYYEKAYFL